MLRPYTVLDLCDDRGELASMILGDLGAEVIKVEPPHGSGSRRVGPFLPDAPEPAIEDEHGFGAERSLTYLAYNRNKRGVTLDLDAPPDHERFLQLVRRADFLFESGTPGAMHDLGLGFEALRAVNPTLVYVAISPFGQDGPHAQLAATDLTIAAMGGPVSLQGGPDRAPLRLSVPQVWRHAAAEAAVGALTAHARMLRTGHAQFVDVSAQCAMVWTMLNAMAASAIQGFDFERRGALLQLSVLNYPLVHECADGHVVARPNGSVMIGVVATLVEEGVVPAEWLEEDWATYDKRSLDGDPINHSAAAVLKALRRFIRRHTKAELFDLGLREGVTFAPVNTVADAVDFPQLRARDYWLPAPLPNGQTVPVPGPFVRPSNTPTSVRRWAPALGQHNEEVFAELEANNSSPTTVTPSTRPPKKTDALPFSALKVLDLSWIGVGPITAKHLADHGATVVHVETADPADRLRLGGPFKDGRPGLNRSQFFGDFNTSKLGLTLDLKNPAALDVAKRLIAWADVYLESFTPGTVDDLGLGYDVAHQLNPSICMVSTCLMGQTGPAARYAGYGFHAGAVAGFYEVTGWPDRSPDGPWIAYTDTIAPRFLATTLMAALDHQRRTGQGQHIDAAQLEMALHFLTPELLDFHVNRRVATRNGNRAPDMAPHGVYPCAGDDQWCAIAVVDDIHWRALRTALGEAARAEQRQSEAASAEQRHSQAANAEQRHSQAANAEQRHSEAASAEQRHSDPAWATDPRFDTLDGRLQHQDSLDEHLTDWTRPQTATAVMDQLQAHGVAAGVVQRSSDLLRDPQLAHRGFYRRLDHPQMGRIPYSGHQFTIAGYQSGPRFPAPCLGQHSRAVMRDLLGMTDTEIDAAYAAGAIR